MSVWRADCWSQEGNLCQDGSAISGGFHKPRICCTLLHRETMHAPSVRVSQSWRGASACLGASWPEARSSHKAALAQTTPFAQRHPTLGHSSPFSPPHFRHPVSFRSGCHKQWKCFLNHKQQSNEQSMGLKLKTRTSLDALLLSDTFIPQISKQNDHGIRLSCNCQPWVMETGLRCYRTHPYLFPRHHLGGTSHPSPLFPKQAQWLSSMR